MKLHLFFPPQLFRKGAGIVAQRLTGFLQDFDVGLLPASVLPTILFHACFVVDKLTYRSQKFS